MMKKVVYFLALCFLLEWAYTTKIKPFVMAEFGIGNKKNTADSTTIGTDNNGTISNADPVMGNNSKVYGIDISHWQKEMEVEDILNKHSDNLSFIICKATDGKKGQDIEFVTNWGLIKEKDKIIKGAYHFYRCTDGAVEQAKHYFNALRAVSYSSKKDLPPIIDFEVDTDPTKKTNTACLNTKQQIKDIQDSILKFLTTIESLTGRTPIIYTNDVTGNKFNNTKLSAYPLWIAYYNKVKSPVIPKALNKNWTFWQPTEKYVAVKGDTLDFDVFNGNLNGLNKFVSGQ